MATKRKLDVIDTEGVMRLIPHRFPFLMIDRLVDVVPGKSVIGIKNVTINEPFFQGHFPGKPVMPGVLIIEALAQTAGALVMYSLECESEGRLVYFMSIDHARFRKPVLPGDTLYLHAVQQHSRNNIWKFSGEAKVNGSIVADAVYTAMIKDPE
ncbi:MAG: 3-hydroxyacyl-ACP dehydratase FabZ [Alphaproteobacteria bacterium]|nr:3-hydroxyacyl-ACP dehydratase FabZ [Alphaproteobacteria bacterium]